MTSTDMLDVALKEWGVICEAVLAGDQAILLRKGGVHEDEGPGRFRLAYRRFALFPAWEHQRADWIKPGWSARCEEADAEPAELTIGGWAEVAGVWAVPSRAAFDTLDDLHVWRGPYVDMRFGYKPDRPLYLVLLEARRLATPKAIAMNDRYWGCKSWVDLDECDAVSIEGSSDVTEQGELDALRQRIDAAMA
ncbi:MAG: DUF1802 family protein [Planctomycetota bacterium]